MPFTECRGWRIEWERIGDGLPGAPELVFLHEGLGSVSAWLGFCEKLCAAVGTRGIVYSRKGYGRSTPVDSPREVSFMHEEALEFLPALLDAWNVRRPVLVGHSDGASIALLLAGSGRVPLAGVVAMAPHVFVEEITLESIRAARGAFLEGGLREKLARHHDDPDSTFLRWCGVWLDPAFASWNIEPFLPRIRCPVLAIQGEDDEYGTPEQLHRVARLVPGSRTLLLPGCRHSPQRDRPEEVIAAIAQFLRTVNVEG